MSYTRLTGGEHRGIELKIPDGNDVRPATSMMRSSIFSILTDQVENSIVLDLFAGAGTFGIEALSRNASFCTFVETNFTCINSIKENIEKIKASNKSRILKESAFTSIAKLERVYDLIFIDPPFIFFDKEEQKLKLQNLFDQILNSQKIAQNSRVIFKHPDGKLFECEKPLRIKNYGQICISFWQKRTNNEKSAIV